MGKESFIKKNIYVLIILYGLVRKNFKKLINSWKQNIGNLTKNKTIQKKFINTDLSFSTWLRGKITFIELSF